MEKSANTMIQSDDQRFIDINIDSDSEQQHRPTTTNDDKKLIFNFKSGKTPVSPSFSAAPSPASSLISTTNTTTTTTTTTNVLRKTLSNNQLKAATTKETTSPAADVASGSHNLALIIKEATQNVQNGHGLFRNMLNESVNASLTLSQAADILLSNLNEVDLYSEDDEDDDDDEDDEDDHNGNVFSSKKTNSKSGSNSRLNLDSSIEFSKKDGFFNSSTLSSVYQQNHSHVNLDNSSHDISSILGESSNHHHHHQHEQHSTPLTSQSANSIDNYTVAVTMKNRHDLDKTILSKDRMLLDELNIESKLTANQKSAILCRNATNSLKALKTTKNTKQLTQTQSLGFTIGSGAHNDIAFRNDSLVEGLLGSIYDRFNISLRDSLDSDVFTELSSSRFSGGDDEDSTTEQSESRNCKHGKLAKSNMQQLNTNELKNLINELSLKINQMSSKLVRQLKQKDKFISKLNRNCDLITALLQARSQKRRVDTQMKFTLNPMPGEAGFNQWKDAMKALARLPGGVPKEFRKSIWLNLSIKYINDLDLDWHRVRRIAFNDRSNPDDDELGVQIVKDLHRTGCSTFSGHENDRDRALLKRVLLAYARYNKSVGYCQGFNIIAALILEIVDKKEDDALMCMIYLIDHILPEGYFTNSMHTLAIDMAVFRELLKTKLPKLYQHLNQLQNGVTSQSMTSNKSKKSKKEPLSAAAAAAVMTTYEPPLTNVFTMQWFLTLFATCLPKNVLLRVWDCIFLEGAEILFRTSIAIWDKLSTSVMKATSADSFYSMMSVLSIRLFDENVVCENDLINKIYSYGQFPLPGLQELRERFTFNITPFAQQLQSNTQKDNNKQKEGLLNLKNNSNVEGELINVSTTDTGASQTSNANLELNLRKSKSYQDKDKTNTLDEEDDFEAEDLAKMISCFALLMPSRSVVTSAQHSAATAGSSSRKDIMMTAAAAASALGMTKINKHSNSLLEKFTNPGAAKASATANDASQSMELNHVTPGAFSFITQMHNPKSLSEQLTLDLTELKKQYKKLKERQRQAHIIIQTASAQNRLKAANNSTSATGTPPQSAQKTAPVQPASTNHVDISSSSSSGVPFSLEKTPVINHLLIKSNDLNRNTVKQTIKLSTTSSTSDDLVFDANLVEKINHSKHILDEIFNKDSNNNNIISKESKKPKKPSKPYYSDDDEDDDDDDDDDDNDEDDQLNDDYDDSFENDSQNRTFCETNQNNSLNESFSLKSIDIAATGDDKKMTLLDLANFGIEHQKQSSTPRVNSPASTSTSSSATQSPVLLDKVSGAQLSSKKPSNKQHQQHQISKSVIINHLINEEKRNVTPVNPFPMKNIHNSNVAKNGLRLGLYK